MARPTKPEGERKQQLNIRVAPLTKIEVEAHAERDGMSISVKAEQLIEGMLNIADDADKVTIKLVTDIVSEIQTVQALTGKIWHEDLTTWAAVSEMLRRGMPILEAKPESSLDNPEVSAAWTEKMKFTTEKQRLIELMARFDMKVSLDAKIELNALLEGAIQPTDNRKLEADAISSMEDEKQRQQAQLIFDMIKEADAKEDVADKKWVELASPFWRKESQGAKVYKDHRRKIALDTLSKGGLPNYEDL